MMFWSCWLFSMMNYMCLYVYDFLFWHIDVFHHVWGFGRFGVDINWWDWMILFMLICGIMWIFYLNHWIILVCQILRLWFFTESKSEVWKASNSEIRNSAFCRYERLCLAKIFCLEKVLLASKASLNEEKQY